MDGAQAPASGFDAASLTQIPAGLQASIDAGDLSGFVTLVWRDGEIVQLNTLGQRVICKWSNAM